MKTILSCSLLAFLTAISSRTFAQTQNTPPPFPSWANKTGAASDSVPASDKELLGQWEGFVSEGDGSNPKQRIANITLTITDGHVNSTGSGTIGQGTYRIAGSVGRVHHIDAVGTAGQYVGKRYEGIFTIEGNTLKWCAGDPGRGRPTMLRTTPASGFFLMVLTRKQ